MKHGVSMNQINPYRLWIGHAGDGRSFQEILDSGIRAVVQLAYEEPPLQPLRELVYFRFPLLDGGGNDPNLIRLAVNCVKTAIELEMPMLIFCSAGMSRSPAIVAAALSTVEHADAEECLRRISEFRPIDLSSGLWREVLQVISSK